MGAILCMLELNLDVKEADRGVSLMFGSRDYVVLPPPRLHDTENAINLDMQSPI